MKIKKYVHPASLKPEKVTWAKKGIPVGRKPERAVQAKVRDGKRITMSHWITLRSDLSINCQAQMASLNLISFRQAAK